LPELTTVVHSFHPALPVGQQPANPEGWP